LSVLYKVWYHFPKVNRGKRIWFGDTTNYKTILAGVFIETETTS